MPPDDDYKKWINKPDEEYIEIDKSNNSIEIRLPGKVSGEGTFTIQGPIEMTDQIGPNDWLDWQVDNAEDMGWLSKQLLEVEQ